MAEKETITNNKSWIKWIIVSGTIIIILALVGGLTLCGLNTKYKYSSIKAEAVEKETEVATATTEAVVEETTAKETTTITTKEVVEETSVPTTEITQEVVETTETTLNEVIAEGEIPAYEDSKDGVPDNGTEINSDVMWDEIWCATFGPGKFLNIDFPGGEKVGSVVIQLGPSKEGGDTIHYVITDLIPGAAWQGNLHYKRTISEKDWMAIVNLKVKEMMGIGNASDGSGCNIVEVVVGQGDKVIYQETFEKK